MLKQEGPREDASKVGSVIETGHAKRHGRDETQQKKQDLDASRALKELEAREGKVGQEETEGGRWERETHPGKESIEGTTCAHRGDRFSHQELQGDGRCGAPKTRQEKDRRVHVDLGLLRQDRERPELEEGVEAEMDEGRVRKDGRDHGVESSLSEAPRAERPMPVHCCGVVGEAPHGKDEDVCRNDAVHELRCRECPSHPPSPGRVCELLVDDLLLGLGAWLDDGLLGRDAEHLHERGSAKESKRSADQSKPPSITARRQLARLQRPALCLRRLCNQGGPLEVACA